MNSTVQFKKWMATSMRALANSPNAYFRGGVFYAVSYTHLDAADE